MRVADAVGLMTSSCLLGGWASLRAQGNTWFDGLDAYGTKRRALIHCQPGSQLRHRSIVQPFRGLVHPDEIIEFENFSLTTMARAAFDEMRMATNVRGGCGEPGHGDEYDDREALTRRSNASPAVIQSHHKVRGLVQARNALALGSARSASPWETRTRLLAELDAGVPRLAVNVPRLRHSSGASWVSQICSTRSRASSSSRMALITGTARRTPRTTGARRSSNEVGWSSSRITSMDHQRSVEHGGPNRGCSARCPRDRRSASGRPSKPDWWNTWVARPTLGLDALSVTFAGQKP